MEASGGFSEAFVRFRGRLLGAESRAALERLGAEIAREKASIPPHELTRLRGIYSRALTRVALGISPRR
jgi:hypothetical protein